MAGDGTEEPLDRDLAAWVLAAAPQLDRLSHYDLLGVPPSADKKEIQRAYFALAAKLHPDKYFGKELGSFAPKMNAILARLSEAYETLSRAQTRRAYDAAHGIVAAPAPAPAPAREPAPNAEREKAMEALRARFVQGKNKAEEHVAAAERARAAGDIVGCVAAYEAAARAAPGNATIAAALAEAEREAGARLLDSHRKKAKLAEQWGRWPDAAASWKSVLALVPDDEEATIGLLRASGKR